MSLKKKILIKAKQKVSRENKVIVALVILAIFAGIFLFKEEKRESILALEKRLTEEKLISLENSIDSMELKAHAVSVYDMDRSERLYGRNDYEVMPMASLAKTMAVIIALGEKKEETVVSITENSLHEVGDNSLFLNEKWKLDDLIRFSLILSSNDGITALSEDDAEFIDKMNAKTKRIGLFKTTFHNPSGLDLNDKESGAYSTALEANKLAIYALRAYPEIFNSTALYNPTFKSLSGFEHPILNTNVLLPKIPNLLFSKTGNTNLAGGNLSVIYKNNTGKRLAITILGSTASGRFEDMEKLIEATQDFK